MRMKIIDFGLDQIPKRAHYNDAGLDVRSMKEILLGPGQTEKIPLGFGIDLPNGLMGVIHPRSSMAAKGLMSHNAPIDSGYKGEIHAIVTNVGKDIIGIKKGDRIAQLVISPIILAEFVTELGDERKEGSFGSTGLK